MNIFGDADILVAVLNKEYPLFHAAARVISLDSRHGIEAYTSPICLAIAFYYAEKRSGTLRAKEKIRVLSEHIHITDVGEDAVRATVSNPRIHDLEDGLEYYSAIQSECEVIISEDLNDFYFSKIKVMNTDSFFAYLANR